MTVIKYGPTIENINLIHDKAKNKRDGVYSFRGVLYRVKDSKFTHFTHENEIFERAGNFDVSVGSSIRPREALAKI